MLDKLENAKKFESPANQILVRNVNIKIKDIMKEQNLKGKVKKSDR